MNPVGWVLGLFIPVCAGSGASGLPPPVPMDMTAIVRPASPNTALAGPEGFSPKPDIVTRRFVTPPDALYAAVRKVAEAQAHVFYAGGDAGTRQAHWVVRSAVFNFPDLVTAQVGADGTLVLWSRSVVGWSDMGVNRKRLGGWVAALEAVP